ncbi:glycosyltransferase [Mesorhizobium huakuii]|uniref:glycosyltransferase n=1 Tax=Mesorhizobium huakuii TaxID=28104 RepID=UPI0024E0AE9B|nr:glycosyltransferase [Mesorhizobium huakuii]
MKILMLTNTFTPYIGGVANSVTWLAESLRAVGHRVLIIAPEFDGAPEDETGVLRIPALQRFGGSDFSVPIPLSRPLDEALDVFQPDIVHSHHPFLLGDTALRVSATRNLPIIYTYHTRYELYGHYVSQDSPVLKRLVLSLALGYCDLCDAVIAPSQSIAQFLTEHGVKTPVTVVPTGIDATRFDHGDRKRLRSASGIPSDAFVVGHVGRLAPEKNLEYLTEAVKQFLTSHAGAHFLVVGCGETMTHIQDTLTGAGLGGRVHLVGALTGTELADAYAAMDVFAFSSHSETQGLVLVEAMAAGIPVVALDAPGAREVVIDSRNGRLPPANSPADHFAHAIQWVADRTVAERTTLREAAIQTSKCFSRDATTKMALTLYASVLETHRAARASKDNNWQAAKRGLDEEYKILRNLAHAIGDAVLG